MLTVYTFTFNPFQENTYLVYNTAKECLVIDPGCSTQHERELLRDFVQQQGLQIKRLINTHCHTDHTIGNQFIKDTYRVTLSIHRQELDLLKNISPISFTTSYEAAEAEIFLAAGDSVILGTTAFTVLHVPGHTPGHIALYNPEDKICFAGDVLFKNSIGRTDLPGGNVDTLLQSIHQTLFPLGDEVKIYPGHGSSTTIGEEKRKNPFCKLP